MKTPNEKPWGDPGILLDKETFIREMKVSAFLGAYKFWITFVSFAKPEGEMLQGGEQLLRAIGLLAVIERKGIASTPEEYEAFCYCRIDAVPV